MLCSLAPDIIAMRARRDQTRMQLASIERQIKDRAEVLTRSSRTLPATYGRHATDWTPAHETLFQQFLGELKTDRRNETGALRAKLMRQDQALSAIHLKRARKAHNAPTGEAARPVINRGPASSGRS